MFRKTVLLAGVTAAFLTAAPALAQDAPAMPAQAAPPSAAPAAAPEGSIQLQPGSSVKGSDGTVLGTLEGVQSNAAGEQELTVRGPDGDLRGVPLAGLSQQGADVIVGWSSMEFNAATVVEEEASTGETEMAPPAAPAPTPSATPGMTPAPTEPATPNTAAQPDGSTPPTPQS